MTVRLAAVEAVTTPAGRTLSYKLHEGTGKAGGDYGRQQVVECGVRGECGKPVRGRHAAEAAGGWGVRHSGGTRRRDPRIPDRGSRAPVQEHGVELVLVDLASWTIDDPGVGRGGGVEAPVEEDEIEVGLLDGSGAVEVVREGIGFRFTESSATLAEFLLLGRPGRTYRNECAFAMRKRRPYLQVLPMGSP
jgi:hypothetical protein